MKLPANLRLSSLISSFFVVILILATEKIAKYIRDILMSQIYFTENPFLLQITNMRDIAKLPNMALIVPRVWFFCNLLNAQLSRLSLIKLQLPLTTLNHDECVIVDA